MLTCVRWYVAYPLSLRHIEEMMQERGVFVDHVRVHRWAIKVLPVLAAVFRRRKRPMGRSWRMDETYIKVSGQWKYLYRAVDRAGDAVDFLLTAKRDLAAARRFLERAINLHDVPEKITIDKSGANTAAIESVKADACVDILMRQNKYLNNIVEQDHRAIKRITRPMRGFKSFWSARRSGPAILNSAISGNSGHKVWPRSVKQEGVFDGQEVSATHPSHPYTHVQGARGPGGLA